MIARNRTVEERVAGKPGADDLLTRIEVLAVDRPLCASYCARRLAQLLEARRSADERRIRRAESREVPA